MKKLISVILILSMIFTLGITSMTASAKYYVSKEATTEAAYTQISAFEFKDAVTDTYPDYTKYDGKYYATDTAAKSTMSFASSGGAVYKSVYEAGQTCGK